MYNIIGYVAQLCDQHHLAQSMQHCIAGPVNLGCANPDKTKQGRWCPVDPRTCPSYYAPALANGNVLPGYLQFNYYYDYCDAVRSVTEAG